MSLVEYFESGGGSVEELLPTKARRQDDQHFAQTRRSGDEVERLTARLKALNQSGNQIALFHMTVLCRSDPSKV